MGKTQQIYNLKKADLVCIIIILLVCVLTIISNFLGEPFSIALKASLPIFAIIFIVVILFFIPLDSRIKGLIYSIIILSGTIFALYNNPSDQTVQYHIASSIVILGLYYSRIIIISYAVILNISFIAIYFINNVMLFGTSRPINFLICTLLSINGIFVVLYFINKWGSEMVATATSKEKEATTLFEKLQISLEKVGKSSSVLDNNVSVLDSNMNAIVKSSKETTSTMNMVAAGTAEQAEGINEINLNMIKALEEVNNTQEISEKISSNSGLISTSVSKGSKKINSMFQQMQTINHAVSAALTTVNVLQSNIVEINNFLQSITEISEQTNLLSLNAAIESARAGEHGRGFSVVANQVGKLAVKTSDIVENIKNITVTISENSASAVEKVSQGENAVIFGNTVLAEVVEYFSSMENSIKETLKLLETEGLMINRILAEFTQVQINLEKISSISEEHAASNQEILAIIENENSEIIAIKNSINEIKQLSSILNEMLHS